MQCLTIFCVIAYLHIGAKKSQPNANGYSFTFFFHLFLSPIFVYFSKKVSPWCLQLYLFLFVFVSVLFLLCWESLLLFSLDLARIHFLPPHPHLGHHVPPPPPLCPRRRWYAWPFWLMRQQIISNNVNIKTNGNVEDNVDDNGAAGGCCKPLINVPYIRTFGAPDQGGMNHHLSNGLKIQIVFSKEYPVGISVLIWECTGWNQQCIQFNQLPVR